MADQAPTIRIDDARIIFRNFAGKETQYNKAGDRNFGVIIEDTNVAKSLLEDGWNIKFLEPREEGDEGIWWLPVTVKYENYPPKIIMVTSVARTQLSEDAVEVLDYSDIKNIDMILRGHTWEVNGKVGVKAYVKTMYITLEEDELDLKYSGPIQHMED